jgi:hypothetical protein
MGLPSVPPVTVLSRAGQPRGDTVPRYCLTAVCAGSAGVHAALIQPHLAESGPLLASAFAVAAAALALVALTVRQPRHDSWAPATAIAVLCLIAAGYLLSRTSGIPLLIAHAEQADPLGAATTAAELAGAAVGAALISRKDRT